MRNMVILISLFLISAPSWAKSSLCEEMIKAEIESKYATQAADFNSVSLAQAFSGDEQLEALDYIFQRVVYLHDLEMIVFVATIEQFENDECEVLDVNKIFQQDM